MMVSTKGRYALRTTVRLASLAPETYLTLRDLSEQEDISEKYLEVIMKALVKAGLVVGLRGKGGGYRLSRPADRITAADVLRVTEGSLAPAACLAPDAPQCHQREACPVLSMWKEYYWLTEHFFEGKTLRQLACQEKKV